MSGFSEWMAGLREGRVQAITEDYGGLPHDEPRTITYMGREFPAPVNWRAPVPNHWTREYIEQRTREIEEATNRYAEGLAERRREAEARAMHHMWHPSDDESNNSDPPRWSFEREHHLDLSFDPATGEITNSGGTLPNEDVLFNPGTLIDTSEN